MLGHCMTLIEIAQQVPLGVSVYCSDVLPSKAQVVLPMWLARRGLLVDRTVALR